MARFLSARARHIPTNPFQLLVPLMKDPGNISLCGGVLPPSAYPIQSMEVRLKDGTLVNLSEAESELAQRYPPFAWGKLKDWTRATSERLWHPPGDWDVSVTAGSMSGLDLVFSMVLDEGDAILVEEFSFLAALDWLAAARITCIPVRLDDGGLVPEALRSACEKARSSGLRVKALYTIPTGQNPTGSSLTLERASALYKAASELDLLIIEDDAYYFLSHAPAADADAAKGGHGEPLLGKATFVGMDTEGRVLRLDTFSKVLAAGFRLGWITGPRELISAYDGLAYFSSQHGSSLSMVILGRMLEEWGWAGFTRQLVDVQRKLGRNMRAALSAAETHLAGIATWNVPAAGMFLWIKIQRDVSAPALLAAMKQHHVLAVHGAYCAPQHTGTPEKAGDNSAGSHFVRISCVLEDEAAIVEGIRRLGELLRSLGPAGTGEPPL